MGQYVFQITKWSKANKKRNESNRDIKTQTSRKRRRKSKRDPYAPARVTKGYL